LGITITLLFELTFPSAILLTCPEAQEVATTIALLEELVFVRNCQIELRLLLETSNALAS